MQKQRMEVASSSITLVSKYIDNVRSMNSSTARLYRSRLNNFSDFIYKTYGMKIDRIIDEILDGSKNEKMIPSPYDMLIAYTAHLTGRVASYTLKQNIVTAKNFLEYCDIEVSPKKFKLKVKLPKSVKKDKQPLSKEDIADILNACSNIRLKTYVMLLAATGMRATEALSIRRCDFDDDSNPPRLFIRGEYTKTRSDRFVFLTNEMFRQLKSWLEYKYRTRRICFYDKITGKSSSEYRTPLKSEGDLLFSIYASSKGYPSVSIISLYRGLISAFGKTLERLGRGQREESPGAQRRKITLHSLRRFVKSTISDLGYYDYSEWFIGHSGSTYYRRNANEKAAIFIKIEPYLTFLNIHQLERQGADVQRKIEELEELNQSLRQRDAVNTDAITTLSDRLEQVFKEIEALKVQKYS